MYKIPSFTDTRIQLEFVNGGFLYSKDINKMIRNYLMSVK